MSVKSRMDYHGMLVVHKPKGMVSRDVSRWLHKRLGRQKTGHVGTLDPLAEGVLPVLFGRATRLQDHLLGMDKAYEFDVEFGRATDTFDCDGEVIREEPWEHITEAAIRQSCENYVGFITQIPPVYSAVKYQGKALFRYAREGKEGEVPLEQLARQVHVRAFELLRWEPPFATFRLECSKGTYVRSLAEVIGKELLSCGMVNRIVRTESAGVKLEDALSLEEIDQKISDFASLLVPLEAIELPILKWRVASRSWSEKLKCGQRIVVGPDAWSGGLQKPVEEQRREEILLVGADGAVFGLGKVEVENSGIVAVTMRRAL